MNQCLNFLSSIFQSVKRIVNSTYLCIKYPFLYPRNRFNDLHYNNYKLLNYIESLHLSNTIKINIRSTDNIKSIEDEIKSINKDDKVEISKSLLRYNNSELQVQIKGSNILISNNNKVVKKLLMSDYVKSGNIKDIFIIKTTSNLRYLFKTVQVHSYYLVLFGDNILPTIYETGQEKLTKETIQVNLSKTITYKIKFLTFLHNTLLQIFFCIPTYTELDSMPIGWRKAFGLQMCKDIKKELKKHNYLYKYRITQIKEKFGCYDEETEILTKEGWKYFKDINSDEIIATLNPTTHYLEYQKISDKIEYHYQGKMYRLKNRGIDLLVTPNHNLYVAKGSYYNGSKNNEKRKYNLELATPDVYFRKDKRFLKGCFWEGNLNIISNKFKIPDYHRYSLWDRNHIELGKRHYIHTCPELPFIEFLKFLGFYVAEGYTNHRIGHGSEICVAFNPKDELKLVTSLIKGIGFTPKINSGIARFNNVSLGIWLKTNCGHKAPNKKVPDFIKQLPPEYIKVFLEYLFIGDGHKTKTSNILTTTSPKLRDDVCELLLKAGYCFSYYEKSPEYTNNLKVNKNYKNNIISKHTAWYINWLKNIDLEFEMSKFNKGLCPNTKEEWIDYNGKVYCVTVPNHIIYIRRNGKGVWCGNSLRWYDNGSPKGCIFPITDNYENLSSKTCINCGKPAKYITKGYICPYCEHCIPHNKLYDKI